VDARTEKYLRSADLRASGVVTAGKQGYFMDNHAVFVIVSTCSRKCRVVSIGEEDDEDGHENVHLDGVRDQHVNTLQNEMMDRFANTLRNRYEKVEIEVYSFRINSSMDSNVVMHWNHVVLQFKKDLLAGLKLIPNNTRVCFNFLCNADGFAFKCINDPFWPDRSTWYQCHTKFPNIIARDSTTTLATTATVDYTDIEEFSLDSDDLLSIDISELL